MPYKTYPVSVTGDFVFFYVNIHPSNHKIPNKQNQEASSLSKISLSFTVCSN